MVSPRSAALHSLPHQRLRCLSPFRGRPRKLPTSYRPITSVTVGAIAGIVPTTATVTSTRITTAAGDMAAAGPTGIPITTVAGATAAAGIIGITGTSGNVSDCEERGFGPFLFLRANGSLPT